MSIHTKIYTPAYITAALALNHLLIDLDVVSSFVDPYSIMHHARDNIQHPMTWNFLL